MDVVHRLGVRVSACSEVERLISTFERPRVLPSGLGINADEQGRVGDEVVGRHDQVAWRRHVLGDAASKVEP
jgi:hypothetical protein